MRQSLFWLSLVVLLLVAETAHAASGRVIKVLPHYLDLKGHHTLSPGLYERDAYQAHLRQHPEQRSGIRFDVQWRTSGAVWEPLQVRVELRGIAHGDLPKQLVLEEPVEPGGWLSRWVGITLSGDDYKDFGEVTAWRVSLWEGGQLLGEQKSFLW